jgi:hypothetical protein
MHLRGVKMAKISKENVRRRQSFCLQGHFACEIEAILASFGFDPYCPLPRWQAWT